jgi:hypothetical protein
MREEEEAQEQAQARLIASSSGWIHTVAACSSLLPSPPDLEPGAA